MIVYVMADVAGSGRFPSQDTIRPRCVEIVTATRTLCHGGLSRLPKSRAFSASRAYELTLSTVTARRFCDQQEMSLQTATGRSLPYEIVRMR